MFSLYSTVFATACALALLHCGGISADEILHRSADPLFDAVSKITAANLDLMTNVKVAKPFLNIGNAIVGFDGKDKNKKPFQLRIDYDPVKGAHVNVMINGERHAYMFTDGGHVDWFGQVINNINGGHYCDVPKDKKSPTLWNATGGERNPRYISGMKSYMKGQFQRKSG